MLIAALCIISIQSAVSAIKSYQMPFTVTKVRTMVVDGQSRIVASGYDGEVASLDYEGNILWQNNLSGYVNHDLYCSDIDGDGRDEILIANADGSLYCLDSQGVQRWAFKQNDVPLYAVTALKNSGETTIVCGGYDLNIYCLSQSGELLSSYPSTSYSITKDWAKRGEKRASASANFLRMVRVDGRELLAIHGVVHSLAGNGAIYIMDVDPSKESMTTIRAESSITGDKSVIGSCSVYKDSNGNDVLLLGTSGMIGGACFAQYRCDGSQPIAKFDIQRVKGIDNFGYRVAQVERVNSLNDFCYLILYGSRLVLVQEDMSYKSEDVLVGRYSYNDMCGDVESNKIILASAQSGGNAVHIIDLNNKKWRRAYEELLPIGNISTILDSTAKLRGQLKDFKTPAWERAITPVFFMSESLKVAPAMNYEGRYKSPIFLGSSWSNDSQDPNSWSRDTMSNVKYRNIRESRKRYRWSGDQCYNGMVAAYEGRKFGAAYWGGHGNDPFYYSPQTIRRVLDHPNVIDKKTVLIYPELEDHSEDFGYVMDNLLYPLAEYVKQRDVQIYIRCKNIFWLSSIYKPAWERVVRGEYSHIFIPSMEETSDRAMDLSIAARLGFWSSGAADSWGSRCARDNPSYDRLRQHSHQTLPNHFLRMMVYHISYGAQYIDNFAVDQEYMSVLWDLIGKGLLYVAKREEVVSYNPLYLAMREPNDDFLEQGTLGKFTVLYRESEAEQMDQMVFSRLNPTWQGASLTEWDFSKYVSGTKDRRLNFLAPFPHGVVMLAPEYDPAAVRGRITDYLHPLYKDIMKSYGCDGKYYYDGDERKDANTFYKTVESEMLRLKEYMPLTVEGEVAWVAAQSAPKHIRLTVIDRGYINPANREATIQFHSVRPARIRNLASGELIESNANGEYCVSIPAGLFVFLDVELVDEL